MSEESAPTGVADDGVTAVVPDVARTQAAELAWSEAEPAEVELPRSWRPAIRAAVGVFAACIAVAGGITAADRHWFAELRGPVPAPAPVAAPSSTTAPPADAVVQMETWALPPVPAAEHLIPPAPPPEDFTTSTAEQDSLFFAGLTAAAIIVYDRNDAINTGHYVCQARAQGYSRAAIAALATSRNPRLSPRDASNMVAAAINAYCPSY